MRQRHDDARYRELRQTIIHRLRETAIDRARTGQRQHPDPLLDRKDVQATIDALEPQGIVLGRAEKGRLVEGIVAEHSPLSDPTWLTAFFVYDVVREIIIIGTDRVIIRKNDSWTHHVASL